MIVDDDEQITNLFEKFLVEEGYEAAGLNDSSKAIEVANSLSLIFLLDLMMPQPDGFAMSDASRHPKIFTYPDHHHHRFG
ncbi:response regulator [Candidatus Villigracilis saccharophilus]|uniref:response regulator n=1 Tax=Candidatus Villigracilis saccharophilus TaxID=3140684 RepID=UPI0031E798C8